MINFEALFKISYGLYIVSTGDKDRGNGYISNTVFQVTSDPPRFAVCCNKNNFTCGLIDKYECFAISVLGENTSPDIFGRFGYRSGKDFNKIEGMKVTYETTGSPIILNDTLGYLECKVVQKTDVGTHIMFIGELVNAQICNVTGEPMTYAYYRKIRKGLSPKNAPTYIDKTKLEVRVTDTGIYKCTACGHIYDESKEKVRFSDLPSDWKCPVCGADKEDFIKV
jgi:flavin reductase (DIM6/NTAB) family NADH-FMN oxidoreductase RutF/rubredoxin